MLRTDHIVFPVWDAEASLSFYRDVMGFALVESITGDDWGGKRWLMMIFSPGDGREVVLVHLKGQVRPPPDALPKDVRHMAFAESSVTALVAWRKKLASRKIDFWEEEHGPRQSIYFEDPNGVVLEITAPPSHAGKTTSRAALAAARRWIGEVR
jgi:catechol 2,3-dioxygenase-like lactoylglutathione lyase family enzyme